jgi:hypothetical protein
MADSSISSITVCNSALSDSGNQRKQDGYRYHKVPQENLWRAAQDRGN